jgi:AbrB family looped-hinge helix DNA binding protein
MHNDLLIKATVTGKRQITIPKEICELKDINTGDQIVFKEVDGNIIFEKDIKKVKCFACQGKKTVDNKTCFICEGHGYVHKSFNDNPLNIISHITMKGRKYNVSVVTNTEDYFSIELLSDAYKKESIDYIQDEISKKILESYSPRSAMDNNLFMSPSDPILNKILENLKTKEAKEQVRKWFRYDRTPF